MLSLISSRFIVASVFTLVLAVVALPSPVAAAPAVHVPPIATSGNCTNAVAIVVASDAAAQSDIYSAVTLAGALGTECLVLAGERTGSMPSEQRSRLSEAAPGGYVVGGNSAVPTSKLAGRKMKRIGGADRWATARAIGAEVAVLVSGSLVEDGQIVGEAAWSCPPKPYQHSKGKVDPTLDLRCANLRGADMSGLDMRRINLYRANLSDAKLRRANLTDAYLVGADVRGADMRDVQLSNANLSFSDLRDADLRKAPLWRADVTGADFSGANLQDAILRDLHMDSAIFETKFVGADLRRANLIDTRFVGVDFSDSDLRDSLLRSADFAWADFTRADLRNADLTQADFYSANLTGVDLRGAIPHAR